uniref:Putative secreted protein n=1 Tax=Amblyomma triste TaxID=251400 RepID=A0A023G4L5_AMBTT
MRACSLFVLPQFVVRAHTVCCFYSRALQRDCRGLVVYKSEISSSIVKKKKGRERWSDNDVTLALKERVFISDGFSHCGKGLRGRGPLAFGNPNCCTALLVWCECACMCVCPQSSAFRKKKKLLCSLTQSF